MAIVLDTGALISLDRGGRDVLALIEAARRRGVSVVTSSGCVAQAWRSGGPKQAILSRVLAGVREAALDENASRIVGRLCASSGTADVVDAHIVLLAASGDVLVTSDPKDIDVLLHATRASVETVVC